MKLFFSWKRVGLALLILLWLPGPAARAQAPAWQMAVATTGSGDLSQAYGSAADAAGNVYIGGSFRGTVAFGGTTLTSVGSYDLFVAKYNPVSRTFEWAVRTGGANNEQVNAVAVSSAGIYIAGFTQSALINFGPSTLSASGGADAFVAKLTPAGSFVWALPVSGDGFDEALALAANGTSVYVGGHFSSNSASFDAIRLLNTGTVNAGYDDGFVAKIADAGATAGFAWAQGLGGTNHDKVTALAVTGADVLVAGSFRVTSTFGPFTLTSAGFQDVFVGKLLDTGSSRSFAWVQRAGGSTGDDVAQGVAGRGNRVYVAGYFDSSTASFGTTTLARAGDYDAFVAQLTDAGSSGSFGWAQRAGGTNEDRAYGVAATADGVCVAGFSRSATATYGSTTLANYGSNGSADIFVTRLVDNGSSGVFGWAQRAGGTGSDQAYALTLAGPVLYVAGAVSPQAIFAPLTINVPTNVSIPFLASLTDPTLTATTAAKGDLRFTLSPNPARTTATVQLQATPGAATATLTLLDALGRAVRTQQATPGARAELDLRGLTPGHYALRVSAGTEAGTRRLVVE
ncbi:T9SS type A sorting domain-containing protein [Hymenobacter sp. 5317J-9]|uniref:T9SS type A sorting domain-containing protein n=1 Tax=Hymenobacter sp. 5317J-9 TaxID=2932250 RepID=UPI001FD6A6E4|nr:T9SS type A sorting domain-containing protein [Hymenobacter sp. 5317J-9]UOQ97777.1 T9SS type A sorting domain-containing protein [Hymenobacter sp. 5317J-9]